MRRAFQGLLAALALFGLSEAAAARDVIPAEKRFWAFDGKLPACDNPDVLGRIQDRFQSTENEYWNSKLEIVKIDEVKVNALRPWGLDHIPRNYCVGRALLSDHTYHKVSFDVAEDQGLIGSDFGVEWCLSGLDRELAYAPNCEMAQP